MSPILPVIKPFQGTKLDLYTAFIPQLYDGAKAASTKRDQILFDILTPEERLAYPEPQDYQTAVPAPMALSNPDTQMANTKMAIPMTLSQTVDAFIKVHLEAHRIHKAAATPLPEAAKVNAMATALQACNAYEPFVHRYFETNNVLTAQTFSHMASKLREYVVPSQFTNTQALAAVQATKAARNDVKRTRQFFFYCWTHGCGSHNGNQCTNKAPNHKEGATVDNRQGGSTRNVPREFLDSATKAKKGGMK
eukprot:gene33766-40856_t